MGIAMVDWAYKISAKQSPEQLRRIGPLIPAGWMHPRNPDPQSRLSGYMLVDTGAGATSIDRDMAIQLRLEKIKEREIFGVSGNGKVDVFLVSLFLPARTLEGGNVAFRVPIESVATPNLLSFNNEHQRERGESNLMPVIGILGRMFTQFAKITIDGMTGEVELLIDRSVLFPKPDD